MRSGLVMATSIGLFLFTRILIPDAILTLMITIAMWGLMRALDPEDPVRYDFALCHYGMSGACPAVPVRANCARCELKGACRRGRASCS